MTKEDYYADRPLEPYSDDESPSDWANIAHYAEENLEKAFKHITELELKIKKLTQHLEPQSMTALLEQVEEVEVEQRLKELEKENAELKSQIEKMKCCENCNNTWNGMLLEICMDCKKHSKWEIKE